MQRAIKHSGLNLVDINQKNEDAADQAAPWYPHVTVATVIEDAGRFLCVEEWARGDKLVINQPAGHLDPGENLIEAAIRETLEETAWQVEVTGFIGLYLFKSGQNQTTYLRCCFAAKPVQHFPENQLDEGIERALWLSHDELQAQKDQLRTPLVLECIEDYKNHGTLPLDRFKHQLPL